MLPIVPQYKTYTIESYAHYILDDPQVKAFIESFKLLQKAADKWIDLFEPLVEQELLKFDSEEELAKARQFNRFTNVSKNRLLQEMIQTLNQEEEWPPIKDIADIMIRDESQPHPNRSDIPLLIFRDFANNVYFNDYLFKGSVNIMNTLYFSRDIDLARQKYMVFAVFLWCFMDPHRIIVDDMPASDMFYDYAPHTNKIIVEDVESLIDEGRKSTVEKRLQFLQDFKPYIHFELWNEDDYAKTLQEGAVLRLDLERSDTGNVVIQDCPDRPNICNRVYLINDINLPILEEEYLQPITVLRKLQASLKCEHCGKRAYLLDKMKRSYCTQQCYHKIVHLDLDHSFK